VLSVRDYLHRPLVDLARHLYGPDTEIIALRAWWRMDPRVLLALFVWYLPFRVTRIFTASDLGGRLMRIILDYAGLFGVDRYVVPAHNQVFALDERLPLHRRYDLARPRAVGGFSRRARIIVNDEAMREFFLSMGFDPRRLLLLSDWIGALYRRPGPPTYSLVFFSEVVQEVDRRQFEVNLERVRRLVRGGLVERLHVKLHPREPADAVAVYRDALGGHAGVEFIDPATPSLEVVNRSAVVMACFSSVLLEALWLGKRIVVLDNDRVGQTMLAHYLRSRDHLVYADDLDDAALRRYCSAVAI